MVEHIAIDVTPREPVPAPSPRRLVNVNVTVPPAAQVGRRSHEPVIVSPLVLSPQLHTIPLTVENIQYHDDVVEKAEGDDDNAASLSVFNNLDHVQLTREGSGGGVDFCLRNAKGDRVLTAADEVGCFSGVLGRNRPFDITVCDAAFTEVFTLKRPFTCNSRALPCSLPRLSVSTPSAGLIGTVKMRWAAFDQHLTIHDPRSSSSTPICHVRRRVLPLMARGANEFKILDPSGKVQIGKIHSRQPSTSGTPKMSEERLAVSFPKSLDSRIKATLVGTLFLVRELYFRP